jgi:hypothetical protein
MRMVAGLSHVARWRSPFPMPVASVLRAEVLVGGQLWPVFRIFSSSAFLFSIERPCPILRADAP